MCVCVLLTENKGIIWKYRTILFDRTCSRISSLNSKWTRCAGPLNIHNEQSNMHRTCDWLRVKRFDVYVMHGCNYRESIQIIEWNFGYRNCAVRSHFGNSIVVPIISPCVAAIPFQKTTNHGNSIVDSTLHWLWVQYWCRWTEHYLTMKYWYLWVWSFCISFSALSIARIKNRLEKNHRNWIAHSKSFEIISVRNLILLNFSESIKIVPK